MSDKMSKFCISVSYSQWRYSHSSTNLSPTYQPAQAHTHRLSWFLLFNYVHGTVVVK